MPTTDQLQFEMQRRVILFNSGTTMPDNSVLGYEGNPNYASTATPGQTLLYSSPRGTSYIELVNGNLWYKQKIPNTWINLTSGSGSFSPSQNDVVYVTGNQDIAGVKNFYSRPTVNGSGVLLVGETGSVVLPNTIVYTTGNQTISGTKTFDVAPIVSGNPLITGVNLSSYVTTGQTGAFYPRNNPSGYITGVDLSSYVTTGQTGVFYPRSNPSGFISSADLSSYALANQVVYKTGDQTIGGNKTFSANTFFTNDIGVGQNLRVSGTSNFNDNVNITGNLTIGGNVNNPTLVLTRGDQLISGAKIFASNTIFEKDATITGNLRVSGTSTFNNNLNVTNNLTVGGSITNSTLVLTKGDQIISGTKTFDVAPILSGHPFITGVNLTSYITTGQTGVFYPLNNPSGFITGVDLSSYVTTGQTGNFYPRSNPSGYITGVDLSSYVTTGQTGNFYPRSNPSGYITGVDLSSYVTTGQTGAFYPRSNPSGFISSADLSSYALADQVVYKTGNQDIGGLKTFSLNTFFQKDVNVTQNLRVSGNSFFTGNLNVTGNLTVAGNINNPNLVLTRTNQTISGIKTFDVAPILSGNPFITGVNLSSYITTGQTGDFYPRSNPSGYITNATLNNVVYTTGAQTISGVKTFVSRPTVNGTGVLLSGEAANVTLPATIVYTTGSQTISGVKTFANNLEVQGTGIFNALDLSNISQFDFSGTNINLINGNVDISGGTVYISGKPVLTGIDLSSYITTGQTGLFYPRNNPSGYITGVDLSSYVTTGQTGNFYPRSNPSGYITGVDLSSYVTTGQTGNFYPRSNPSGYITGVDLSSYVTTGQTGAFYPRNNPSGYISSADLSSYALSSQVVYKTGDQVISGIKTFEDYLNINTQNLGNFRLNIAGDKDENAGVQIDSYGINPPQILMRRARGTPTALSGVLKDDVLFNLQARAYVSGLNAYSTNSRAAIRLIAAEDWVGAPNYTGQGANILFRTTNIGNTLSIDKVVINTSGLNVLDGNIYISGSPVVNTTSDQIISGNKTFLNNLNVYGTGDFSAVKVSNIDQLFLSGIDMVITGNSSINASIDKLFLSGIDMVITGNSSINVYNAIYISGNPVLTGIIPSSQNISNVVYTTGNQNISGTKTFLDNIAVSGTGNFNNVKVSSIDKLYLSGVDVLVSNMDNLFLSGIDIIITGNSSINVYNDIYISGNKVLTGIIPSSQTITDVVYISGDQVISGIKTFNNNVTFSPGTNYGNQFIQLGLTNAADRGVQIFIPSGSSFSPTAFTRAGIIQGVPHGYGIVFAGGGLSNKKGYLTSSFGVSADSLLPTGYEFATLDWTNRILSGNWRTDKNIQVGDAYPVLTTGNQTISGNKTFKDTLFVRTISGLASPSYLDEVSININAIDNALLLPNNYTVGGAIALKAGSGNLAGGNINLYAGKEGNKPYNGSINALGNLYINDDPTISRSVAIYKTGVGVSELNVWVQQNSVSVNNAFSISGVQVTPAIYVDRVNNQIISGNKTFVNNLIISGTGIFDALDLNNIDTLNLSGVDISLTNGNVSLTNRPTVNGTGVLLIGEASSFVLPTTIVYTTGSQTVSGIKTFAQTGSFDTLQITNKKLSSYNYISSNFTFGDAHINIVNSSNNVIGTLPSSVTSGINYYVKNLNTGVLLITGSNQRTIDGFSNINLYKNESLQLLGVNNIGYTGWISLSVSAGVS